MNEKKDNYVVSVYKELKHVVWPTKPVIWQSTKIVLGLSAVLVLFVFASDQLLNFLLSHAL